MGKAEIISELTENGNIIRFSRTPSWEKAFEMYNTANPNDKKHLSCGHCFRTVLDWLRK